MKWGSEKSNVQQTTLLIGNLLLVVASTTLRGPFDPRFGKFGEKLRKITPRPTHFKWPVAVGELDDEAVELISNMLLAARPNRHA